MRLPLLPIIVLIVVNVGIDLYIWQALRSITARKWPARLHLLFSAMLFVMVVVTVCLPRRSGSEDMLRAVMWLLFGYLSIYFPKLLYVTVDHAGRIPELFKRRRIKLFTVAGVAVAVFVFCAMWWGALMCRNAIDVREVDVYIDGLPASFDGYRIVQFSDAHVGTYSDDTSFTSRLVDKINRIGADLVVFTGDIVNMRSEELDPHVATLAGLRAADGVFSILGNHDYGDYSEWPSPQAKERDVRRLADMQRAMGWNMLNDAHMWLRRGNDSIALIGVENIGDPPFPTYGSLSRAYPDVSDDNVKILLSHNPMHWVDSISGAPGANVALTLSGHTHAMQVKVLGWSPAAWRYPTWGGLYTSPYGRQLYVNIGTGTVGFPARIGATPEITVITLKRTHSK